MTNNQEESCPICSNSLEAEDITYPLQCNTDQCTFNMCLDCTKNLLNAGGKTQEASDGNKYKLNVQCPSCRSKFSVLLSDVILLREADREVEFEEIKDSELSAADLRKKYDGGRIAKLKAAKGRYFHGMELSAASSATTGTSAADAYSYADEFSIEHDSCFGDDVGSNDFHEKKIECIDAMLFCGLAESMSKAEQVYVKELMTSGSTTKLVQATHILASIVDMNQKGGTPSMRQKMKSKSSDNLQSMNHHNPSEQQPNKLYKSQSQIMSGTNSRYQSYEEKLKMRRTRSTNAQPSTIMMSLSSQSQSELQIETTNRERWKRLFPIPVRMPKVITLRVDFDLYSKWLCPITFVDDEVSFVNLMKHAFNGSAPTNDIRCSLVRDAYKELKVTSKGLIVNKESQNTTGVENILSYFHDMDGNNINDEAPTLSIPWRRVVVSSVKGSLFRTGIKPGDVITHIDGEFFDGNTVKLKRILSTRQRHSLDAHPTFQIIVNAEVGIAEALRIRRVVAENQHDEPLF